MSSESVVRDHYACALEFDETVRPCREDGAEHGRGLSCDLRERIDGSACLVKDS